MINTKREWIDVHSSMSVINILDLPIELLVNICSSIQFKDLCNLELSSKHFRLELTFSWIFVVWNCFADAVSKRISRERVDELKEMEGENISEQEENVVQSRLIDHNKSLYFTILTQTVQINAGPTLQAWTLSLQGELPILYAGTILMPVLCTQGHKLF